MEDDHNISEGPVTKEYLIGRQWNHSNISTSVWVQTAKYHLLKEPNTLVVSH